MPEPSGIFTRIRLKVFIGFSVVLMAVIVAAIINFVSLNRMSTSLSVLSEPDEKIDNVRVLLAHLSNEEMSARYYSLTGDSQYLSIYRRLTDSVHYRLAELKTLIFDNDKQMVLADSISQLAAEREAVLNAFIENRQKALTENALKENQPKERSQTKAVEKSEPAEEISEQVSEPNVQAPDTTAQEAIVQKEDGKGFFSFGWVKDVFSSKEKKSKKKGVPPSVQKETTATTIDSARVPEDVSERPAIPAPDEKVYEAEIVSMQAMKNWSSDELILLSQNKEMMDRIRNNVTLLEQDENAIREKHAAEAKEKAAKASEMITLISVLGLMGTLIFMTLILRDITRSNRLRAQLENERKRVEKLAKVKEEFLANMSHEIRTPLNAIIGYSELLAKDLNKETKEEFVGAIQKSSGHLLTLVNQILDFSKLEAGKQQPEKVVFDFHQLVSEVYETFRLQALEKNLEFSFDTEGKIPHALSGDAMSMKQILINLVSNAIKFTERGRVSIHAILERERSNSCRIKIAVSDTGMGIANDAKEKIFSAFTQSNSEITRKFGGTGLGLTITRKLTESLGGKIELVSEEGKGSVFTVSVPFMKATAVLPVVQNSSMKEKEVSHTLLGKLVLIVDDEEMNVKLCKVILESWGLKTEIALNGKEALKKITENHYDLVLLDIQMPEMSGIEVVKAIRVMSNEEKRITPVVALTANVFGNENDEFLSAGFSGELIKPFRERQLYEELERQLLKKEVAEKQDTEVLETPIHSGKPYSLKYLEKTSGSDKQFIESMLQSFIQNNTLHLQLFHEAIERKDYEAIHNLAHKMIPSFRYLEMRNMESKLRQLESATQSEDHLESVSKLMDEITRETERLFPLLSHEIEIIHRENLVLTPTSTSPIES